MAHNINVIAGETLRFVTDVTGRGNYFRWNAYDATGTFVSRESTTKSDDTWTVPDGVSSILVSYPNIGVSSITVVNSLTARIAALEAK